MTPVLDGGDFIDDAIASVVTQAGDFFLHYHVQDGGSGDDTLVRVQRWRTAIARMPLLCRGIDLTVASERDWGLYDAINRGFARTLPNGDEILMGWIGADDRLAPGAFATLLDVRAQFPDADLVGGRVSMMNQAGAIAGVQPLRAISRRCLAAGLHDGRTDAFVMQEGTFWWSRLWRAVGGLDASLKLAGDWDLWRRMAQRGDYLSVDTILGFHRRRAGQMSERMEEYHREVDAVLDAPLGADLPHILVGALPREMLDGRPLTWRTIYEHMAVDYADVRRSPGRLPYSVFRGDALRYHMGQGAWRAASGVGVQLGMDDEEAARGWRCLGGFSFEEGPVEALGMDRAFRWSVDGDGAIAFAAPVGRCTLHVRNELAGQKLDIFVKGVLVASVDLRADLGLRQSIAFDLPAEGERDVRISPSLIGDPNPTDARRRCYILEDVEWLAPSRDAIVCMRSGPTVVAPVMSDPRMVNESLA